MHRGMWSKIGNKQGKKMWRGELSAEVSANYFRRNVRAKSTFLSRKAGSGRHNNEFLAEVIEGTKAA